MPERPSEPARHCPQCGAALQTDAKFCTACGAAITAPSPKPVATPARQRSKPRWLWLAAGLVVALVAVAAIAVALNRPSQPAAPGVSSAIPTAPVASQNIPFPNVARVTVDNAHVMGMTGAAVIVDVRDKPFFDQSHVRGALSLPLSELPARFAELPKDKAILEGSTGFCLFRPCSVLVPFRWNRG